MTNAYTCECGLQWSIPEGDSGLQCSCGRPIHPPQQDEDLNLDFADHSQGVSPWSEAIGNPFTRDAFKRSGVERPKPGNNFATILFLRVIFSIAGGVLGALIGISLAVAAGNRIFLSMIVVGLMSGSSMANWITNKNKA